MVRDFVHYFANYYRKGTHSGKNVRFLPKSFIDGKCVFEGYNSIGMNSRLYSCHLGAGTYISKNVELVSVKIGRFCSIGSYIRNSAGRHPVTKFVSTHPSFFSKAKAAGFTFSEEQKFEEIRYAEYPMFVTIGNDVWIGDNVSILDGVRIGDGAIIGTNSLITKDIEPYTVNVGVPARKINSRFDEATIKYLLDFKWWDKDFVWIKSNYHLFSDIDIFKNEFR